MKTKVGTVMFRAIKRSFIEGTRGMFKNGLMTVTSLFVVTACIFIFGVFLMITFNINHMTAQMADSYQVDVYIERPEDADDMVYENIKDRIKDDIVKVENVDAANISFVDGKEKFKNYKAGLDKEDLKSFEGLPDDLIPDAFAVKLEDISLVDETCSKLSAIDGVEDVENSSDLVEAINGISGAVKTFSVWIIVIFALVSLFIISNTIKLTVHNRRKEINIMKYVGATDSYIKGPFIMEGMLVGIVSAVIAFFISQWSYLGLITSISTTVLVSSFGLLSFNDIWLKLIVSYVILGSIIGAFGSSISVRRYLKV